MSDTHRIIPSSPARLTGLSSGAEGFHDDRKEAEREFKRLRKKMADYQFRRY